MLKEYLYLVCLYSCSREIGPQRGAVDEIREVVLV